MTASDYIQKSRAATSVIVGPACQKNFEGGVRTVGLREVQLDGMADSMPAAPHSFRIDRKVQWNIEQNKFTFRLNGCTVGLERTRIRRVVDRLHRLPPILKVG